MFRKSNIFTYPKKLLKKLPIPFFFFELLAPVISANLSPVFFF